MRHSILSFFLFLVFILDFAQAADFNITSCPELNNFVSSNNYYLSLNLDCSLFPDIVVNNFTDGIFGK